MEISNVENVDGKKYINKKLEKLLLTIIHLNN